MQNSGQPAVSYTHLLTGLSRGFFYNNPNVKQVMMELKEKQQGMILQNPKSAAIAKAQEDVYKRQILMNLS